MSDLKSQKTTDYALVIDSDPLVQKLWKLAALRRGKTVFSFNNSERLLKHSVKFLKSVPVYIRNECEAHELRKEGFYNVYVTGGDINYRRMIYEDSSPPKSDPH